MDTLADIKPESPLDLAQGHGLYRAAPALSTLEVGAVINTASGSCDADAEIDLAMISERAGLPLVRIWCASGADLAPALGEAKDEALDLLIVLGGDGTIRSAAALCAAEGPCSFRCRAGP